jgi:hypothetical protein
LLSSFDDVSLFISPESFKVCAFRSFFAETFDLVLDEISSSS